MDQQLSQTEQDVLKAGYRWIDTHEDLIVRLLDDLVSRASVTGTEGQKNDTDSVVGYLFEFLQEHTDSTNVTAEPLPDEREYNPSFDRRDNLYTVLSGHGDSALVCTSHTDIVPPGTIERWPNADPYRLQSGSVTRISDTSIEVETAGEHIEREIRDELARAWNRRGIAVDDTVDVLIGRGAYDNKASIVALVGSLMALEAALEGSQELSGDLIHGHLVDEEVYQVGAKRMVGWRETTGWLDSRSSSYEQVSAVVLEGSYGFAPVIGHRGLVWVELEATGTAAHASTPELGTNAVVGMSKALSETANEEYADRIGSSFIDDPLLEETTVAAGTTIVGGDVRGVDDGTVDRGGLNSVPDWCETTFDIRIPRWSGFPEDISAVRSDLCERVETQAAAAADDVIFNARIPEHGFFPSVALVDDRSSARSHPLVETAIESTRAAAGYEPSIEVAPGVTDAAFIYHGTEAPTLVEYGPSGALSHEPYEFVERDQVIQGVKSMIEFAVRELGVTEK